ncbi:hypothetical protein [Cytobacillus oceanisediminis]|nr:hypothetical protein [Cytobacillus oceanisediminis]
MNWLNFNNGILVNKNGELAEGATLRPDSIPVQLHLLHDPQSAGS